MFVIPERKFLAEIASKMLAALWMLSPAALVIHNPQASFIHAARPATGVKLVATSDLGTQMLGLMDKWMLDDEISKPFASDVTADACMVPIELEWLNAKVCELEECPLDLPEAFSGAWERVKYRGEGCVTVNALREEIQNPST